MKMSRRGGGMRRTERSKAAHTAANRGRRSQGSENMGRRSSSAHLRMSPVAAAREPISPNEPTPDEARKGQ